MDFRDAIEIARRNPGASVTRGEDGDFIVRRADGTLFGAPVPSIDEIGQLRRENERLQQRYDDAFALLDETKRHHRAELTGLEAKIHQLHISLHAAQAEHEDTVTHLKQLEAKLAKVSRAEWDRIKAADERDRQDYAKALREERHVQKCACLGEVENCARCDGRGSYTTDGYGNPVYT